jgi:hypothetical protein
LSAVLFALPALGGVVDEQGATSFDAPQAVTAFDGGVAVVRGVLGSGDADFFSVGLSEGDQLFVALFEPGGGAFLDTRLGLFAPGSTAPDEEDDDGGRGFLSRRATTAASDGSWKIGVTGFRDAAYGGQHAEAQAGPAPYTLVIAVGAPPLDGETEPNDAAPQDELPGGGGLLRAALERGDVDRFAVPAGAGDGLFVSLFELDATTLAPLAPGGEFHDTRLGLFAPGGTAPVEEDDDGGPGLFSNADRAAGTSEGGTWTLGVTGFRDADYEGHHPEEPFAYALVAAVVPTTTVARCDVVAVFGRIDVDDINAIFAARNQPASGPSDPRDADGDGTITVLDGSQCRLLCTHPRCARSAPISACGLLGIEPLGVLALLELARRRRARGRESGGLIG